MSVFKRPIGKEMHVKPQEGKETGQLFEINTKQS